MVKIEDIASVHLGKAGDGSVVKPYVTPDNIDATLLVGIPRHLNRTHYNIDDNDLPFVGYDTWNCYEFSTLTTNGFPVCGVIRCVYPSDSPNIVESKSLKLYMNSFNMARLGDTVSEVIDEVIDIIYKDLSKALGVNEEDIQVAFCDESSSMSSPINNYSFMSHEHSVNVEKIEFNQYNEDPAILVVKDTNPDAHYNWRSAVLRSNCRVTNQPDWGDIYIAIKGNKTVTPESLLKYIISMRRENHFHEEICETIYMRLFKKFNPEELVVSCLYVRRGGIDINPTRASNYSLLDKSLIDEFKYFTKTVRQ